MAYLCLFLAILMPKKANPTSSEILRITLSQESVRLLSSLAEKGIYGRNPADVAGRFIDESLRRFVTPPQFNLERTEKDNEN
jgi:hypothetical protein